MKSILTFFTVDANTQKLQIQTFSKIKASLVDLIAQYKAYKKALGETNLSISDFIKWLISGQAQIDATKLKILALRGAALLLNMALGVVTGLVVSSLIGAITSYTQRIDTAATKTKEAADAASNTTSSLKDLVDAYEELGDKSGWSTEDFDQAKDIQEELLALAKEQGTLDENKANQLDLQNGKYEEQLGLLKDITEEQLKASESKLIQSKDAQGNKLIKTAKDNNRSHFFSSVSANTNRGIMNELKDAGIDVFNKNGSFGAKDLNDPDSIAKYYSELGRALDYIVQNTTEAQRAAGGAYNTVYKYLMDEQSALRDDVDSYNDSTDAVNENVNARRKLQAIDFWSDGKSNGMDISYSFDKVNSAIETLKNTIDGFDASKLNELLWGTNEGLSDEQAQALANLRKALTDMDFSADTNGVNAANDGGKSAGEMKKILDWLNSSVDSETISFEQLTDAIKGYGTAMDEAKEKTDAIKSAFSGLYDIQQKIKNSQFGVGDLDATESKIESILQLSKFFGDNKDLMDMAVPVVDEIEQVYTSTSAVSDFDGAWLMDKDISYYVGLEPAVTNITRNQEASVETTLGSKYPIVFYGSEANYYSGNFSGVIIKWDRANDAFDFDGSIDYRETFINWLTNKKPKVLKMYDGRAWLMNVNGNVSYSDDEHPDKVEISFDFVETGNLNNGDDMKNAGLI